MRRLGRLGVAKATGRGSDSPFEDAVAAKLRAQGHEVEHQVGSAGFRIDLAVVDPRQRGRYLLGIECDGAAYHSARSARDRDRLRQQVLEGLGWTIHRIWSTDWFRNPDREIAKTEDAIRRAAALSNGGSVPPREDAVEATPEDWGASASPSRTSTTRVSTPRASTPLERAERRPVVEESIVAADPYQLAEPAVSLFGWEFHEVPLHHVAAWAVEVVDVESPVHEDEVAARVAAAAKLKRVGSRIRSHLTKAVHLGVREGALVRKGHFLWRPGHEEATVRSRGDLPAGHKLRAPKMIPPEEIEAALLQVIEASYGISPDEVVARACRLMGFRRTGPKLASVFADALGSLVERGAVELRGQFLHLPEGTDPD